MWVSDSTDDKIYAYNMSDKSRDATKDFDTLATANDNPLGIWSNGTTMWVSNLTGFNVFAYNLSTKARETSNEFTLHADNAAVQDLWSDGTTIWALDYTDTELYAYTLATGARDSGKDIDLHANNSDPTRIWSDGTTIWVGDATDFKLYAYTLSTGARDSGKDYNTLTGAGNDRPHGMWSDGTTLWVVDTIDVKIYAYHSVDPSLPKRDYAKDFDTLSAAGNAAPAGVWSDGTTMWVADAADSKIYAYNLSDKSRDASKDFNTLSAAGNGFPLGIWSNGTTMWVADVITTNKLYAYNVSTKAQDTSKEITLDTGNAAPQGIWGNNTTIWVSDPNSNKLFAYTIATGARDTSKEFDLHSDNDSPTRIWSDGTTMWVVDSGDVKIYAYTLSGARDSGKDYNTLSSAGNDNPHSIWSDGTTMWVADNTDDKIYAYHTADVEPTPTPTNTPTATVETIDRRYMASRIEPAVTGATVSAGDDIRLSVNIFGRQNVQDQGLAEHHDYVWQEDGSTIADAKSPEIAYTAPSSPGTYKVIASLGPRYCSGDTAACSASFEIKVRRPSAPPSPTPVPANPPGEIPTILTDSDGNQYEVFTPVEGGTFDSGEGYSIVASPGAVPNGEFIGVRMSEDGAASNAGATHQRYTLGGNMYGVHVVNSDGASITDYLLEEAAKVCVPLPDMFRSRISDLALVTINTDDGSLTVLAANVRLTDAGASVCGNLSELPATLAVGNIGSPDAIPTPTPIPTPVPPETGGTSPTAAAILWLILLGTATTTLSIFILNGRKTVA